MLGKRYIGVYANGNVAVYANSNVAVRDSEYGGASVRPGSSETTLTVDLDRLPRADATDQDLVRHHREQAKYHAEEAARLTRDDVDSRQQAFEWHESRQSWHAERTLELETACSTVKVIREDELVRLRPIVEAAQQWADNECGHLVGCQGRGRASTHDADCPYGIAERRLYDAVRDRESKARSR